MVRFLLCFFLAASLWAAEVRDGNWWRKIPRNEQLWYTLGLFDGISAEQWLRALPEPDYGLEEQYQQWILHGITNAQMVDGLNRFYKDPQNQKIRIAAAIWVVIQMVLKKPQEDIDAHTQFLREQAKGVIP